MSLDLMLLKAGDRTFVAASDADAEIMRNLKTGQEYGCTLKELRNGKFHRKLFSLLRFAYDNSERVTHEYKGQEVQQSFDRFRQDLVILSGHYHTDVTIRGEIRATAQSLEYGKLSQALAEEIYSDVLDVICEKVFTDGRYTREKLEELSGELMKYV